MAQQYEAFEKKRTLYFIIGLIAAFMVGLGYTWSVVQTPIVQAMGGESVTATVALCYTVTVLCSTMSPTILGGFTKHLNIRQMILLGGLLFGLGYLFCGHVHSLPLLFLTYGLGTGVGAGLIYPTLMGYSASVLPDKTGISSGLMSGIYGGAAIIWSPVLANMIESGGLSFAFNIIGILLSGHSDRVLSNHSAGTGRICGLQEISDGSYQIRFRFFRSGSEAFRAGSDPRTDGKNEYVLRGSRCLCLRSDIRYDGHQPGFPDHPERLRTDCHPGSRIRIPLLFHEYDRTYRLGRCH